MSSIHKNSIQRFKVLLIASTLVLASTLSGCEEVRKLDNGAGLPEQVFQPSPYYTKPINSVGTLTEAYIQNTESLLTSNKRLQTLCVAYGRCEQPKELLE